MSFERRRASHVRLPVRVPALTEETAPAGTPNPGETENLSRSGVLLWLEQAAIPGAAVRVTLRLRRRAPLTLMGTVVWTRPHPDFPGWALGIHFGEELPGELVAEIADEEYPPWARHPGDAEGGSAT